MGDLRKDLDEANEIEAQASDLRAKALQDAIKARGFRRCVMLRLAALMEWVKGQARLRRQDVLDDHDA